MKALVLYGDYDLRYEEFREPETAPGTVKVKVGACGICGSDIPRITAGAAHYYPIVLGHEFAGTVTEVGEGVADLKVGDHVAAVPLIPCMSCPDCKAGHYSQCKHYSFIGSRIQGGYGQYVVLPAANAVKIDRQVSWQQGALFEPATVALHGVKLSGFEPGGTVAVLGGGTIGLFALQWARILGAKTVVVFGRDKEHLRLATALGADAVISTLDADFYEKAMSLTADRGFDYCFETAGSVFTLKLAFRLVANHGSVCDIGTPTSDLEFTPAEWELLNRKEFRLTGSWMSGDAPFPGNEWQLTAECFADGRLKFDDRVFHAQIPVSDTGRILDTLREKSKIKGRILLVHEEE